MKARKVITMMEDVDLEIEGVTLLTVEEAKALPVDIRKCGGDWWLRSPSYNGGAAYREFGIRPALKVSNLKSSHFQIGDKIKVFGYEWTVISNDLVLCNNIIEKRPFRKDWWASDANDYEASDVKKWLDEWYVAQVALA